MARSKSPKRGQSARGSGGKRRRGRSPTPPRRVVRRRSPSPMRRGGRRRSPTPMRGARKSKVVLKERRGKSRPPARRDKSRSPGGGGRGRRAKSPSPAGRGRGGRGRGRGSRQESPARKTRASKADVDEEVETPSEEPWESGAGRLRRPEWTVNSSIPPGEEILTEFRKLTLGTLIEVAVYNRSPEVSEAVETAVIGSIAGVVAFAVPPSQDGLEIVLRDCIGSNTLMNHFIKAELGPTGHFFRVHLCRQGEEDCSALPGTWVNDPKHVAWVNVLGGGMLHSHCWRIREYREIDEPWLHGCFTTVNVATEQGQVMRYVRTRHEQKQVHEETVAGVLAQEKSKAAAASGSRGPELEFLGVAKGGKAGEPRYIPAPVLPGSKTGAKRQGVMGQVDALGSQLAKPSSSAAGDPARSMVGNRPRTWRPSSFLGPRKRARDIAKGDPSLAMPTDLSLPPPGPVRGGDAEGDVGDASKNPSGSPGQSLGLAKLVAAAQTKAQRERKLRGDPSKLLAMRAAEGSTKSSSSSGVAGVSKDDILDQVCAALGVDASGKPKDADDGVGDERG